MTRAARTPIIGSRVSRDGPDGVTEAELPPVSEDVGNGHTGETTRILRHMERCIAGDENPLIDAAQAAKTLAVAMAAKASIESGQSVPARMEF